MPSLLGAERDALLAVLDDTALKGKPKGDALASLVCHALGLIPGVTEVLVNTLDAFHAQEVDVLFNQSPHLDGFPIDDFIPTRILVECKNLNKPMGAIEVAWFYYKLQTRGLDFGILVSSKGLTGSPRRRSGAQNVIEMALSKGIRIVTLNTAEVRACGETEQFVGLIKTRVTELVLYRTNFC